MIDLDILKCIFVSAMAEYSVKRAGGVRCGIDIDYLMTAYNYMTIADAHLNEGCDITPATLCGILSHQNKQTLVLQLCC